MIDHMSSLPYVAIFDRLLQGVMRAQLIGVQEWATNKSFSDKLNERVNCEFMWLVDGRIKGVDRHLFYAPEDLAPLPSKSTDESPNPRRSTSATRISSLVLSSLRSTLSGAENSTGSLEIESPLAIVYRYLTDPNLIATKAYALFACRSYLFQIFECAPDVDGLGGKYRFSAAEVQDGISAINTSFRERYESKGRDPMSAATGNSSKAIIRHYLAMRGFLHLRFKSSEDAFSFFKAETIRIGSKIDVSKSGKKKTASIGEFVKATHAQSLPEVSEVINELFGLPIPIRGADTIFRGGLRFSAAQGLVLAIHGGPGTGKTSVALALGQYVAPFGIKTLFVNAEETTEDLKRRMLDLVPEEMTRLSFFANHIARDSTKFFNVKDQGIPNTVENLLELIGPLIDSLKEDPSTSGNELGRFSIANPCRAIFILDGLNAIFANGQSSDKRESRPADLEQLYRVVNELRKLKALVIITTGEEWFGDSSLDYMVDVAIRLKHDSVNSVELKPARQLVLTKARHQLCSAGSHGIQIGGAKGVRFSPQANYQIDRNSAWTQKLPNKNWIKRPLTRVRNGQALQHVSGGVVSSGSPVMFVDTTLSVDIQVGSHVFINGSGSGGKASLALKIATAQAFERSQNGTLSAIAQAEKVLIISFLYPKAYYETVHEKVHRENQWALQSQFRERLLLTKARVNVIHLHPGYLTPNDLFNRIEWALEIADLEGRPYTSVILDGIHNVFIQFPHIEKYPLFWPQVYSSLRTRNVTTITTHTTLTLPQATSPRSLSIDDSRSEPLRHALVQKTDYQFEVDPIGSARELADLPSTSQHRKKKLDHLFAVRTVSAISSELPRGFVIWSREDSALFDAPREIFPDFESPAPEQVTLGIEDEIERSTGRFIRPK